uniref:Uncharacterized protein n=1 Tax=Solanum lycopersicum TaxID=4081 RepID=A0A3Q7FXY6_SOLLC
MKISDTISLNNPLVDDLADADYRSSDDRIDELDVADRNSSNDDEFLLSNESLNRTMKKSSISILGFPRHVALNQNNNPMLQDPDGAGNTGLTKGDKIVLNEFK